MKQVSPFYVYLTSSASTDFYTNNTLTSFTNNLTAPLTFPQNEEWNVAVHSIFSSNIVLDTDSKFVKVVTDIINPVYSHNQALAITTRPRNDYSTGRLLSYEPVNKEYFALNGSHVSQISISFTTEHDTPLKLTVGQPTLVILEFKRMENKKQFVVRVDSSQDPTGSAVNFQASLPPMLSLDPRQRWAVTLNSIIYNGEFKNILPSNTANFIEVEMPDPASALGASSTPKSIIKRVPLIWETLDSQQDLFDKITKALSKFMQDRNGRLITGNEEVITNQIVTNANLDENIFTNIRNDPENGILKMSCRAKQGFLKLPYAWGVLLGARKDPTPDGFIQYKMNKDQQIKMEQPMNYNAWVPNFMMVFASFVDHNALGHISAPILRTIPLTLSPHPEYYRTYEPKMEEYHTVTYSQLANLQFHLRQINGDYIQFKNEDQTVIISLKFIQV